MSRPPSVAERRLVAQLKRLTAFVACLALLCACSTSGPLAPSPATAGDDAGALSRLLAYQQKIRPLNATELARERRSAADVPDAEHQMQLALLALHPRSLNLARARAHLDTILSGEDAEARRLQALARMLLEHIGERTRLEALNDRLTQQLEQSNQKAAEVQALADTLQQKLDALAEIERNLPARPPGAGDRSGAR